MEIYHNSRWTWRSIIYFYAKRFFTIYPCLIVALAIGLHIGYCEWTDIWRILHLRHGMGHFWTINVNIVFYLLFPLLSIAIKKIGRKPSVAVLVIGFVAWIVYYQKIVSGVLIYVPMCVAGVLVYLLSKSVDKKDDNKDYIALLPVVIFTFMGFVMYSIPSITDQIIETVKVLLGTFVCSTCLYFIVTRSNVRELLSKSHLTILQYLGQISYEIYLIHLLIMMWILNVTKGVTHHALISETVICICGTLLISISLHSIIQIPINNLIKRLKKYL